MRGSWWHGDRYTWNRECRDKGWNKGNRDEQRGVRDVMEIGQTWGRKGYSGGRQSRMDLSEIHQWSISNMWAHSCASQVHSWLPFHVIVWLFRSCNLLLCHNNAATVKQCWSFCFANELWVACCSGKIIHHVNNLKETSKKCKSSYLMSQDCAEVNLQ